MKKRAIRGGGGVGGSSRTLNIHLPAAGTFKICFQSLMEVLERVKLNLRAHHKPERDISLCCLGRYLAGKRRKISPFLTNKSRELHVGYVQKRKYPKTLARLRLND